MCFGIRISSPFHLNTLNISIQNIKCPKNTKNACADIIFSPANRTWTTLQLLLLREERGEPSGRWDTDISSAELKIRTCLYCWRWTMLSSPLASHQWWAITLQSLALSSEMKERWWVKHMEAHFMLWRKNNKTLKACQAGGVYNNKYRQCVPYLMYSPMSL